MFGDLEDPAFGEGKLYLAFDDQALARFYLTRKANFPANDKAAPLVRRIVRRATASG
jgi:hypothetical protein